MELLGMVMLRIAEQQFSKIRVLVDNRDQRSLQFQVCLVRCTNVYMYMYVYIQYSMNNHVPRAPQIGERNGKENKARHNSLCG